MFHKFRTSLTTLTFCACTCLCAGLASTATADLSAADRAAIDGQSGLRVLTSDGAFLGITNGLYFPQADRVRLFVVPRAGAMLRRVADQVTVTTFADRVTLRGTDLILDATAQRVRNAAPARQRDDADSRTASIALLGRF